MTAGARIPAGPGGAPGSAGTVAAAVARFLRDRLGCDRLFTVPGEAFLPLLAEAEAAGPRIVTSRHEAGAGFAAIADARLRGGPGVVAVNRSPGAANVAIALDAAREDPTPLLCVVGGPRRGSDPALSFQASDTARFLGALVPAVMVADGQGLPRALRRVETTLTGPVPGPAVLVVPEDVWSEAAGAHVATGLAATDRAVVEQDVDDAVQRIGAALEAASRPVLVAGRLLRGGSAPGGLLARLARRATLPVLTGSKQQDLLDNRDPGYAGHLHVSTPPATRERLAQADVVLLLGDLPGDIHLAGWYGRQRLLIAHPAPAGPGDLLRTDPAAVLERLAARSWPAASGTRVGWCRGWRALEDDLCRPTARARPDGVDFTVVAAALDACLPGDAILVLDAGNFSSWIHRYVRLREGQRLLALAGGAMGFGVPGAVGAALHSPERTVVAVTGDGGLLMGGNELATARAAGCAPVVVVADNRSYGTIRGHQARLFPDAADCGTTLATLDLVTWAAAFGLPGELLEQPAEALPAVRRALASRDGYLLQVRTSLEAVHANFDLPIRRSVAAPQ